MMTTKQHQFMPIPGEFASLVDILRRRAIVTPDDTAYVFLDGADKRSLTYAELDEEARVIAATLQLQASKGERVLLMYPQGLEFLCAFYGCLYAGAVGVLVYPPANGRMAQRIERIIHDCGVRRGLTSSAVLAELEAQTAQAAPGGAAPSASALRDLAWIRTDQLMFTSPDAYVAEDLAPSDLAFLQYTSGSTGSPKGVMISHGNILANQDSIRSIFKHTTDSRMVSWLPVLHDMGLIGSTIHPLYCGFPLVFMAPLAFIQRPVRWLQAISEYRATTAGGPNFAFDLCVRRVLAEDKEGLDLSSWQVAFNGAEPVRRATLDAFYEAFKGCGFRREAQISVYGLAESTLIVSGTEPGVAITHDPHEEHVSNGPAAPNQRIAIVDPHTFERLPAGVHGEVWTAGDSVAVGYWGRDQENEATFRATILGEEGTWLRTGDMGFMSGDNLHVSGRIKDLIIVRGRNYHAEDLEWSLESVPGLKAGHSAVFLRDENDPQSLTVVAGVGKEPERGFATFAADLRARIYADHQLDVGQVTVIRFSDLPKTTSGKTQRRATRELLLKQKLAPLFDEPSPASATSLEKPSGTALVPPATDEELELRAIWADVLSLPVEEVGVESNFFTLGGMSVLMLELAKRLGVSLELVFKYPTIRSFLTRSGEYEFPDVTPDIHLKPPAFSGLDLAPTNIALITGANGLFGFHFVVSMLRYTSDTLWCLIRGANDAEVRRKFESTAAYYGQSDNLDMSRIRLIRGDFAEPRLGATPAEYAELCEHVQKIYHIGSHVNNWLPYEGIREINVEGTRNLLELARTGRRKEMHYASTSTFSPKKEDDTVFLESDDIDPVSINKYNGYDISKYVSETLCKMARAQGTPVSIYRMVWVGGRADTGLSRVNDGFNIMLRILITLKAFPAGNYLHDIVPVDLMADAMASMQGKAVNRDFHLTSQSNESVDMQRIVTMLRGMGYYLEEVPRERFVELLRTYPDELWDEHCRSYRQLVIRLFDEEVKPESFYDSTNVRELCDPEVLGRMRARFVDDWFRRATLFLVRQGALPTPRGATYNQDLAQVAEWNDTASDVRSAASIHELFQRAAEHDPDKAALIHGSIAMTYGQLDLASNRIANLLAQRGVPRGSLVGVCLDRSFDLYASILGVLKAGCAFVPLDPTYPSEVLAHILSDSAVSLTLASSQTERALTELGAQAVCIDPAGSSFHELLSCSDAQVDRARRASPHDLAYVVYTSGSTGKPKGVMVEHHSVTNLTRAAAGYFGLTRDDNVLQFATMNFDSFIEEVFPILSVGGILTLIGHDERMDVTSLKDVIRASGVTFLKFPTAFWHRVADCSFADLGVRAVGIGGEEADMSRYRAWVAVNPQIPVINTYGPTEITVTATVANLGQRHVEAGRLSIGRPIANTCAHVLDEELRPVPVGVTGELYISGEGVARGYLNREEETRRAFLRPSNGLPAPLYRTGDLARWSQSGELDFLGRSDTQVKVRGYRVELGAIESTLHDHPDLARAAAVVRNVGDERRLIAFFVPHAPNVLIGSLREYLRHRLPSYMMPDGLIELDAMPLSPSGKVDRGALERMELSWEATHQDYVAPRSELEHALVELWREQLGVGRLGIDDDFLELGGHSLMAISLLQKIEQRLGWKLSVQDLYSHLTVRSLARHIEAPEEETQLSSVVPLSGCDDRARRNLFLVHGVGGNLASFYPLARNLQSRLDRGGDRVALWGIQANPVDGRFYPSAHAMVADYVEHIRAVQPHGPYWLGGWSYGVSIAYLVAAELQRQGEEVERFVALDAEAPTAHEDFVRFLTERSIEDAHALYEEKTLAAALREFGAKFGFVAPASGDVRRNLSRFLGYPGGLSATQRDRYNLVCVANLFNCRHFAPETSRLPSALLVRASQSEFMAYYEGWDTLLGHTAAEHRTVDGDHWSIMSAQHTASVIGEYLIAATSTRTVLREASPESTTPGE